MATRPLPEHGTYARANGSPAIGRPGCECSLCLPVRRSTKKHNSVLRQLGRPGRIDAAPAREHLLLCLETTGYNELGARIAVRPNTLRLIAIGQRTIITRSTMAKIFAIAPSTKPAATRPVDATGAVRKCRALHAGAHSCLAIAAASGAAPSKIKDLLQGTPRIRQETADKIDKAYTALAHIDGGNERARNRSRREGWHDPQWWDDWGHIDDPAFDPDTAERLDRNRLADLRREEILHLARFGCAPEEIHRRLHEEIGVSYIREIIRNAGPRDRSGRAAA